MSAYRGFVDAHVVRRECDDAAVNCLIFEGFRAFHDDRLVQLLDVLISLDFPRDFVETQRKRRSRCSAKHLRIRSLCSGESHSAAGLRFQALAAEADTLFCGNGFADAHVGLPRRCAACGRIADRNGRLPRVHGVLQRRI